MIKYIRELKQTMDEFYNSIVLLKEKTLEHNDILRKIDKVLPKENNLGVTGIGYASISGSAGLNDEQVISILESRIIKDYFTKEFLNKDATTTKKIYVVTGDNISTEFYKEDNNTRDGDRWFEFNGQEYYFN